MADSVIDLRPDHLELVRSILQEHVPGRTVVAFGSRVKWTAKEYSDLDLAILGDEPLPRQVRAKLDDAFDESELPFKVDIVLCNNTNDQLRDIILRDAVDVHTSESGLESTHQLSSSFEQLHLPKKHSRTLETLIRQHLPDVDVWVYSNRIGERCDERSDLDLVLRGPQSRSIPSSRLRIFENALSESTIPNTVNTRDWALLPIQFQTVIEKEHLALTSVKESNHSIDRVALSNVVDLRLSSVDKKSKFNEIPVKLCNYTDVYYNSTIRENMAFMEATASEREIAKCKLHPEDVVITKDSEKYDDIGVPTYVMEEVPNLVCGYHLAILRPYASRVHGRYLFYALSTSDAQTQFHHYANGITRFSVRKADIGLVEIPLPGMSQQLAIANILGTLDDKIELNRRLNETLEAMAQALFKSWFVDFEPVKAKMSGRDSGLPRSTSTLFPTELIETSRINKRIPIGWTPVPLNEVAQFLNGLALQKYPEIDVKQSLPVIKIAELRNGLSAKSARASNAIPEQYIVNDGDFLFSWSGSLLAKFWTGGRGALNQHLFKVTSRKYPKWFFAGWVRQHLSNFREIAAGKATTMGHIQRRHLEEAMVICPPTDTLSKLDPLMSSLLGRSNNVELENRSLVSIRDTLLPKLLSGELRVADAEKVVESVS